jgi:thymidylate synthase
MISCNQEEYGYINLITRILKNGDERKGRNGAITRSIFGHIAEYSLYDDTLPLFTTKKVFFRGVVEELLWMLRGSTDANELKEKNIHIWDAHSSREHLDKTGLEIYHEGDCGPIYGFQWRHCGAEYVDCDTDYSGQGVDQLANVIDGIKKDPFSRRHIINAWNPIDLSKMALTPCHAMMQFYVDSEDGLSCMMTQRSADVCLG